MHGFFGSDERRRWRGLAIVGLLFAVGSSFGCPTEPAISDDGPNLDAGEDVDDTEPDATTDATTDTTTEPDVGDEPDADCDWESDHEICEGLEDIECGEVEGVEDSCGVERTVDCGECTGHDSCGGGAAAVPNQCGCAPLTVDDCATDALEDECGEHSDGCGGVVECGECADHESCVQGSEADEFDPGDESEETPFVCREGAQCREFDENSDTCQQVFEAECGTHTDECGNSVDCGGCEGDDVCNDGQCVCVFEGSSSFCNRAEAECGTVSMDDNCGDPHVEQCECPDLYGCGDDGQCSFLGLGG